MNIEKSFSYPFEDREWISKLGLGAVIAMVPILNFAWSGYMVELIRNVMRGDSLPLPNWDEFGRKFNDGLMLAIAGLVYAFPMLIVICLPLSFMIVPAILSGNQDMRGVADAVASAGGVLFTCLLCVFVIYALLLSIVYPAILVLYAREGTLASCFKFREVSNLISRNMSPFLTAWGISLIAGLVVGFVSGFAQMVLNFIPCLGQIASFALALLIVVYTSAIYAHLFGQFGRIAFPQDQTVTAS
jgi:hypothetical protein